MERNGYLNENLFLKFELKKNTTAKLYGLYYLIWRSVYFGLAIFEKQKQNKTKHTQTHPHIPYTPPKKKQKTHTHTQETKPFMEQRSFEISIRSSNLPQWSSSP